MHRSMWPLILESFSVELSTKAYLEENVREQIEDDMEFFYDNSAGGRRKNRTDNRRFFCHFFTFNKSHTASVRIFSAFIHLKALRSVGLTSLTHRARFR